MPRYVGSHPKINIEINGVPFEALLDTGSQVTTIQLPAFEKFWDTNQLTQPPESWVEIIASNGKPVKVHGYWEPTLQVGEVTLPQQGVIVVQAGDRGGHPVILGTNVFKNCYSEILAVLHQTLPTASSASRRVIQKTITVLSAQQRFANGKGEICTARIRDIKPVTLPPNSQTLLWCRAILGVQGRDYPALVEPIQMEDYPYVRAAKCLVNVSQGKVPVRLINLSNHPVALTKHCPVAQLSQVSFQDIIRLPVTEKPPAADSRCSPVTQPQVPWWEELHVGDENPPQQQQEGIIRLVKEYHQAFSKHATDYGEVSAIQHTIPTGSHPPIKERYRPLPPTSYQTVKEMIQEMKDSNVIRDSRSPWAAPLVLVKKKDGSIRFCVDYRKINQITHKDAYPLPRIEESLTALGSSAYFST